MTWATADLADAYPDVVQVCGLPMLQYGGTRCFGGPIRTLRTSEPVTVLRGAFDGPGDGAVLVVDAGGWREAAIFGDTLAARAIASGWSGVIVNGVVRDAATLATLPLGVMALGTCPRRGSLAGSLVTGGAFDMGGARFTPGHWVYCDDDGIIVSSRELALPITV